MSNEVWNLDFRVVVEEVAKSEKTDEERDSQPTENLRGAMTAFSGRIHGANTTRASLN